MSNNENLIHNDSHNTQISEQQNISSEQETISLPSPPPPLLDKDIENLQLNSNQPPKSIHQPKSPLRAPSRGKVNPPSYTPAPPTINRPPPPSYDPPTPKKMPPPSYIPPTPDSQIPKKTPPPPRYLPNPPAPIQQQSSDNKSLSKEDDESISNPKSLVVDTNVGLNVVIPQGSPKSNLSGRSPSLGSVNDLMTKKLFSTSQSSNNVVLELRTDGETSLLQWNFDKKHKHSLLKLNLSQGIISWNNNQNWAIIRGNTALSQSVSFIELERIKGVSQMLHFGLCKSNMNFSASPSKMELSTLTVEGDWVSFKVKSSMKNDKIGVLYDLKKREVKIFKNGSEISSYAIPDSFSVDLSEEIYPVVFLCGDIELKITENPELEKYTTLSWCHSHRPQLVSTQSHSSEVAHFLEQIGLDKLAKQPKFEKMDMSEFSSFSESDLRKLNVPLHQRKRILSSLERWEKNSQ